MKRLSRLLAIAALAPVVTPVFATSADLGWQDLAPAAVEIANPFATLEPDQMDALRKIIRLETEAGQQAGTEIPQEALDLRAELIAQGLDPDALFASRLKIIEARRTAATAVNDAVLDREVRLPGYVLPLEFEGRKATEFLLVPTVGACIHTPPPPANQVIHVVYPEGIEVTGLYDPVWIEGALRGETTMQDVRYVDGSAKVEVSYTMRADGVVPYQDETD